MSISGREPNFDPWKSAIEGDSDFTLFGNDIKIAERLTPIDRRPSLAGISIASAMESKPGRHAMNPAEARQYVEKSYSPEDNTPRVPKHRKV